MSVKLLVLTSGLQLGLEFRKMLQFGFYSNGGYYVIISFF